MKQPQVENAYARANSNVRDISNHNKSPMGVIEDTISMGKSSYGFKNETQAKGTSSLLTDQMIEQEEPAI